LFSIFVHYCHSIGGKNPAGETAGGCEIVYYYLVPFFVSIPLLNATYAPIRTIAITAMIPTHNNDEPPPPSWLSSPPLPAAVTLIVRPFVKGVPKAMPSAMVAVTVTVPSPVVESLLPLIVAPVVPGSLTAQVMFLLVAPEGVTLPVKVGSGQPAWLF